MSDAAPELPSAAPVPPTIRRNRRTRRRTLLILPDFAVPYSEAHTLCDTGVVEYRVFRRRHRGG